MLKKEQEIITQKKVQNKVGTILVQYISENKGKAFTAKSLHDRCIENTNFDMSISEIENLCYGLHNLGKIRLDIKENVNYYFSS
ncbi:MAG: hypothetical protein HWN79_10110 [Candidatus Lokiarchaeota archaeon]|nr:hypothetical protein [Candidatus Lokiarchaeota archaeon]